MVQPPRLERLIEQLKENAHVERLGEVGAGPCRQEPLNLAGGGVRAEHDHRDVSGPWISLQMAKEVLTGQVGQMKVEQDEIGLMLASQVQTEPTLHGRE